MICNFIKKIFKKKELEVKPIFEPSNKMIWRERESVLLDKINEYRHNNGKPILLKDDKHYEIASNRNYTNLINMEISHDWFYSKVRDVLSSVGVFKSSENLSYGYRTIDGIFNSWIKSDGHNGNILGNWNYTGISIAENDNGRFYVCQIFGK